MEDPIESLRRAIRLETVKACEWDGIAPENYGANFISFSPDNPYSRPGSKLHKLTLIYLAEKRRRAEGQNPMNGHSPHNNMYAAFHQRQPTRSRMVSVPLPEGPLIAIGKTIRIEYEPYGKSRHVGTRFFHNFGDLGERMIKERPILVSDRKGNIFFVPESKKYPHFSERGILG